MNVGATGRPLAAPQLKLEIACDLTGRSHISGRRVSWPWSLPRGFHQHGRQGPITVLPQAAAAGLLPGDRWRHDLTLAPQAKLRMIEAGATAVHGGGSAPGRVGWRLRVAAGAVLALFAQPFVLLPGAALRQELALILHPNATVVLCDGICLRDPADAGISWQSVLTAEHEDGSKLFRDAQSVDGPALVRLSELHGDARAFASVSVLAPEPVLGMLETALRPVLAALEGYAACAPLRGGAGLALRIACPDGGALTRAMAAVQTALDQRLFS